MYVLSKENKFFMGFIGALGVFTVITLSSVASDETANPVVPLSSDRSPASIEPLKPKPTRNKFQAIALDLCNGKEKSLEMNVSGQFIQMKGRACDEKTTSKAITIINQTNGFTASVMPFGKDQFQTDLIQLNQGSNQIVIQYFSPKGVKIEQKIQLRAEMNGPQI